MSRLSNLWNKIIGKSLKKDRILTRTPEKINDNILIKELSIRNQSLEGQLAKVKAVKREKEIEKKNFFDEVEVIKELKEKSDEIKHERVKDAFPLVKFNEYLKKNKKIALTDKDDKVEFDNFKSFVVINDEIGIMGQSGEIWARGKTLNQVIYKPETLRNQLKRGRITLAYDSEFNYVPDLEKVMMPELKQEEDEQGNIEFIESERTIRPFKEMLMERIKENNVLSEENAYLTQMNSTLTDKTRQLLRAFKVLQLKANLNDSELSKAIESVMSASKNINDAIKDSALLTAQKLVEENLGEKKDEIIEKLTDTLEDVKSKTSDQRAADQIQATMLWAKKTMGNTTVINPKETEELKPNEVSKV